jgi:cytochrome c-type biogenesis protein CcmH/NrfF
MENQRLAFYTGRSGRLFLLALVVPALVCLLFPAPAVAVVTKAQIKDISGELVCYCGCANKVVATCGCGTADEIEADIRAQLEAGKTREQIIAAYVAKHGEQGLATPVPEGFNVTAWIMPIVVLIAGGLVIRTVTVRWRERGRAKEAGRVQSDAPPAPADVKHGDRILRDLEDLG